MRPYKIIEHTADVGLEVFGESKETLFINAARGMFSLLLSQPIAHVRMIGKRVMFNGTDDELLLVSWLQELLYICMVKHLLPMEYESFSIKKNVGTAYVRAVSLESSKIKYKCEIKAVTYHQLQIQSAKGIFQTKIFFDV